MGDAIPFELRSLDADAVGELLDYSGRHVRDVLSVKPEYRFPAPCSLPGQHRRWMAGEVLEWRELNRVLPQVRRRSHRSKSTATSGHGGR